MLIIIYIYVPKQDTHELPNYLMYEYRCKHING